MRVTSNILQYLHLDNSYSLLTAKNVNILLDYFNLLDLHGDGSLNDLQFYHLLHNITDLSRNQIYKVFDMLDVDGSGGIEFDEFYLLMCILVAVKDSNEKQFIYRHSRTVFDLLDEDGSNSVSAVEFENLGFIFNFEGAAVASIFNEFDISGDQELDYKEFRMFAMACIDRQVELEEMKKKKRAEKMMKAALKKEKRENKKHKQNEGNRSHATLDLPKGGSDETHPRLQSSCQIL